MIKKSLLLLATLIFVSCATNTKLDPSWQTSLNNLKGVKNYDSQYRDGAEAYNKLISSGKNGYQVLSDAWAYGEIAEKFWLEWEHDFYTRAPIDGDKTKDELIEEYRLYLNQRLLNETNYFEAAVKRLSSDQGYKDLPKQALSIWLATEDPYTGEPSLLPIGFQRVAYAALKKIAPETPEYDFDASKEIRKKQFKLIDDYFAKKDAETQEPPAPNDPFSN